MGRSSNICLSRAGIPSGRSSLCSGELSLGRRFRQMYKKWRMNSKLVRRTKYSSEAVCRCGCDFGYKCVPVYRVSRCGSGWEADGPKGCPCCLSTGPRAAWAPLRAFPPTGAPNLSGWESVLCIYSLSAWPASDVLVNRCFRGKTGAVMVFASFCGVSTSTTLISSSQWDVPGRSRGGMRLVPAGPRGLPLRVATATLAHCWLHKDPYSDIRKDPRLSPLHLPNSGCLQSCCPRDCIFQSLFMCYLTLFNEFLCISSQHVSSALYCDSKGPVSPPDFRDD